MPPNQCQLGSTPSLILTTDNRRIPPLINIDSRPRGRAEPPPWGNRPPHRHNRPCTPRPAHPGQLRAAPARPPGGRRGGAVTCLPARSAWRRGRHLERWQQRLCQGHPGPRGVPVSPAEAAVSSGLLPGLRPRMGRLARCLARGEYGQLRDCPLFESDFLQVRAARGGPAGAPVSPQPWAVPRPVPSAMGCTPPCPLSRGLYPPCPLSRGVIPRGLCPLSSGPVLTGPLNHCPVLP